MFTWKWVGTAERAGSFCWDSFYPVLYEIFHPGQPGQEVCLHHVTFLTLARSLSFTIWRPWIWGSYLLVWLMYVLNNRHVWHSWSIFPRKSRDGKYLTWVRCLTLYKQLIRECLHGNGLERLSGLARFAGIVFIRFYIRLSNPAS